MIQYCTCEIIIDCQTNVPVLLFQCQFLPTTTWNSERHLCLKSSSKAIFHVTLIRSDYKSALILIFYCCNILLHFITLFFQNFIIASHYRISLLQHLIALEVNIHCAPKLVKKFKTKCHLCLTPNTRPETSCTVETDCLILTGGQKAPWVNCLCSFTSYSRLQWYTQPTWK